MYRRNHSGSPLVPILVVFALLFVIGPFLLNIIETFLPLLVLIVIVVVASLVMFGADINYPLQRMLSGILGVPPRQARQQYPQEHQFRPKHQFEESNRNEAADRALYRAGYRPDDNPDVQLADIGLLVYEGSNEPKLCRLSDVPTDATHIRPFIVLNAPHLPDAGSDGVIRFNLVDGSGKLRYTSRSRYTVKRGQNPIIPKTWLPLTDQQMDGTWSLQLCIGDNAPFAVHEFHWLQIGGQVRAHFNGDGEIDELMQPAINQNVDDPVSLDELLADQAEDTPMVMNAKR